MAPLVVGIHGATGETGGSIVDGLLEAGGFVSSTTHGEAESILTTLTVNYRSDPSILLVQARHNGAQGSWR